MLKLPVLSGIACVLVAGGVWFYMQRSGPTYRAAPFSAEITTQTFDTESEAGAGIEKSVLRVYDDGTEVRESTDPRGQAYYRIQRVDGSYATVIPAEKLIVSGAAVKGAEAARVRTLERRLKDGCALLPGVKPEKTMTVLGVQVNEVASEKDINSQGQRIVYWFAPSLDCYSLKTEIYVRQRGNWLLESRKETTKLTPGPPDRDLRKLPDGYTQRAAPK